MALRFVSFHADNFCDRMLLWETVLSFFFLGIALSCFFLFPVHVVSFHSVSLWFLLLALALVALLEQRRLRMPLLAGRGQWAAGRQGPRVTVQVGGRR